MGGLYIPVKDSSNRQTVRSAITDSGWAYLACGVYVDVFKETNAVRCKDRLGNDCSVGIKYFDAEFGGSELVSPTQATLDSSAKRMEIDLDLEYDFDLIKGQLFSSSVALSDLYFGVSVGVASLGEGYMKSFVENINLKEITHLESNGVSPKKLLQDVGAGANGNVIRFYFRRSSVSLSHTVSIIIEHYRA